MIMGREVHNRVKYIETYRFFSLNPSIWGSLCSPIMSSLIGYDNLHSNHAFSVFSVFMIYNTYNVHTIHIKEFSFRKSKSVVGALKLLVGLETELNVCCTKLDPLSMLYYTLRINWTRLKMIVPVLKRSYYRDKLNKRQHLVLPLLPPPLNYRPHDSRSRAYLKAVRNFRPRPMPSSRLSMCFIYSYSCYRIFRKDRRWLPRR